MKRLIVIVLAATAALAQSSQSGVPWLAHVTTSISGSGTYVVTLQQNGANVQNVQSLVISCGANTFTVSQAQNGAAATATALTQTITGTVAPSSNFFGVLSPYPIQTPVTLTAWIASNVGTGTPLGGKQPFSTVATLMPLPGRSYIASFASNGTGQNYSFTVTNTGSGSCTMVADVYGVQLL